MDEVQECPLAITSLKYFYEQEPDYHIVVAGSLLGIHIHSGTGFPVGKVDHLKMYPLTFKEFLKALGRNVLVESMEMHHWVESSLFKEEYKELLRQYYYVGSMPEVVDYYAKTKDITNVRQIQNRILSDYSSDFSKHIPGYLLTKVMLVWNSLAGQLAKENKKFIYGFIKKGGRVKEFEDAIQWLVNAGLVYKINKVSKLTMPLKLYEEFGSFKLFLVDLGLLGTMVDAPAKNVLIGDNIFEEYKGAFTEQYVAQQMIGCKLTPYYYTNANTTNEIDFVLQKEKVYPVEVKAEENLKSKSLKAVLEKNKDLYGWRFSMVNFREQDQISNVPLYLVEEWLLSKFS